MDDKRAQHAGNGAQEGPHNSAPYPGSALMKLEELVTTRRHKMFWSPEEDRELVRLVSQHGRKSKRWSLISSRLPGRSGKQCRERYHNHLAPDIVKGNWTREEDELLRALVLRYGRRWAKISEHMPHRTDNTIKNRFYSVLLNQRLDEPVRPRPSDPLPGIMPYSRLGDNGERDLAAPAAQDLAARPQGVFLRPDDKGEERAPTLLCDWAGCRHTFSTRPELVAHMKGHLASPPHACGVGECREVCNSFLALVAHLQTHKAP